MMNPPDRVSETIHSGHFMASNVHDLKTEDDEEIDVVSESGMEPPDPEVRPDTKDDKPVTFYKFGPITTRSIAIDISLSKLNKCIQIAYEKGKLTTPKWKNFKGLKLDWKDRIRLNNVIWRAWHMQFVLNNKPKYCFFSIPDADYWHNRSEASIVEGMYWKRKLETICAQYTRWRHFYFKHGDKHRRSVVREYSDSGKENRSRRNTFFDDELLFSSSGNFTPPLSTFDNDDDFTNWFTDTLFSSLNQPYMFPNPKQFAQSDNADLVQPGLIQLQPSLEEIMASLVQSESNSSYMQEETLSDSLLNASSDSNVALAGADSVPASSGPNNRSLGQITGSLGSNKDYQSAQSYGYSSQMNNYTFIGSPGGGHSSSTYRFEYEPPMPPAAQMQYSIPQNERFNVNLVETAETSLTEMTPLIIPANDDVTAGSSRQIFGAYSYHEGPSKKCTKKRSLQVPQTSFNHRFNSQPNMWPQSANESAVISNDVGIISGSCQSTSFPMQQSPPATPLLLNLPARKKRVIFERNSSPVTETATPPKNSAARRKRASFDNRTAALNAGTSLPFGVNVDKTPLSNEHHSASYKARSESFNQTKSAPFTAELLTNPSAPRVGSSTILSATHRSSSDVKQELKNATLRKTSIAAAKEAVAKLGNTQQSLDQRTPQQSLDQRQSSNSIAVTNTAIHTRHHERKLTDNNEIHASKKALHRKNRCMEQLSTTSDAKYVVEVHKASTHVPSHPSSMMCPPNDPGGTGLHHQGPPPDHRRISAATCLKQPAVKNVQPNEIRASPYSVPTVTSNYAAIYNHMDMDQIATSTACNSGSASAPVESKGSTPPIYKPYSPTSTLVRGVSHCGHPSGAVLRPIPMNLSRSADKQSAFSCLSPSNQLLSPSNTAPSILYNANKGDVETASVLTVPLNLSHSPLTGASMQSSPLNPSTFIAGATPSPLNSATATTPSCLSSDYFRSCLGTPVPPTSYVYTLPTNTTNYFSGMSPSSSSPSVLLLHSLGNMQFPMVGLPYSTTSAFPTSTKEEIADKIGSTTKTDVLVATSGNQTPPNTAVDKNSENVMPVSSVVDGKCSNVGGAGTSVEEMRDESKIKSESPTLTSTHVNRPKQTYSSGKGSRVKNAKRAAADSTADATERKRLLHLNAEQSRRCALKGGFEKLEELLPNLKSNATKITNAVVLLKAGERTRELKKETGESASLIENLKKQIKELKEKINNYQKVLPAQSTKCKSEVLRQRVSGRVKQSVETDPKFWLLFKIIEPLLESFRNEVKGTSLSEVIKSAGDWSSRHCNHAELRPIVSQLLVSLATDSPILSSPTSFVNYITQQVQQL